MIEYSTDTSQYQKTQFMLLWIGWFLLFRLQPWTISPRLSDQQENQNMNVYNRYTCTLYRSNVGNPNPWASTCSMMCTCRYLLFALFKKHERWIEITPGTCGTPESSIILCFLAGFSRLVRVAQCWVVVFTCSKLRLFFIVFLYSRHSVFVPLRLCCDISRPSTIILVQPNDHYGIDELQFTLIKHGTYTIRIGCTHNIYQLFDNTRFHHVTEHSLIGWRSSKSVIPYPRASKLYSTLSVGA